MLSKLRSDASLDSEPGHARKSINDWLARTPAKKNSIEIEPEKDQVTETNASIPFFRPDWKAEFMSTTFQPRTFRAVCSLGALFLSITFVGVLGSGSDGVGGSSSWYYWTWAPYIVCALAYFCLAVLFSIHYSRDLCMRYYNFLCAFSIVLLYATCVTTYVILDIRMAKFGSTEHNYIHCSIDFSRVFPDRYCNNTDPAQSSAREKSVYTFVSGSCNNLILSGTSYSVYVLLNLLPMIYRMSPQSALCAIVINSMILIFSVLAVGTKNWVLLSTVLFQLIAGLFARDFCRIREMLAKQQFAVAKGTILAAEQNSNLLYTLIPQNVVDKMATHTGDEMLGTTINHCTIMFCSLEPQEEFQATFSEQTFDLLNETFSAFDRAVQSSGMFKYQHVSDWYIVACPRAARPFDELEQERPYPDRYRISMILLADELKRIAKGFNYKENSPLWLKVGIHCGPIAGAVVGSHRSFYCLYGDSINTSARMCKYAKPDKVHCTADFAALVCGTNSHFIRLDSRGVQEIKGKGMMETFDITVEGDVDFDFHTDTISVEPSRRARVMSILETRARSETRMDGGNAYRPRKLTAQTSSLQDRTTRFHYYKLRQQIVSVFFPSVAQMKMDALSPEGRLWINDPSHRVDHRRMVFCDANFERQFSLAHAHSHQKGLVAALLLHLAAVACQWHLVLYPEYDYDFEADGLLDLEHAKDTAKLILDIHWGLTFVYSMALFFVMWKYPTLTKWCGRHFVPVKILHLACSIAAFSYYPAEVGWTIVFCVDVLFLHCWMGTLSFRNTVILTIIAFLAFTISLPIVHGFMFFPFMKAVAYMVGSIWISRISNYNQRIQWRLHHLFDVELSRLRDKILDLLPPNIAQRMINSTAKGPTRRSTAVLERKWRNRCEDYTAVVLQLDLCKFTVLSQSMSPIEVARMVHSLFSVFDRAVQERSLFKMDTIGDAYVVAGFLPPDASGANALEVHGVCVDILYVARTMIHALEAYRDRTGKDTHCRIGVSTGKVIAGVLGRLQPRFHIFGQAVRTAEQHEQTGMVDAVHASRSFMDALATSGKSVRRMSPPGELRDAARRRCFGDAVPAVPPAVADGAGGGDVGLVERLGADESPRAAADLGKDSDESETDDEVLPWGGPASAGGRGWGGWGGPAGRPWVPRGWRLGSWDAPPMAAGGDGGSSGSSPAQGPAAAPGGPDSPSTRTPRSGSESPADKDGAAGRRSYILYPDDDGRKSNEADLVLEDMLGGVSP